MTRPRTGARPRKPAATPEELEHARELLNDGVSYREITRTLGIAKSTLMAKFPGQGWTYKQGGEFRWITRKADITL